MRFTGDGFQIDVAMNDICPTDMQGFQAFLDTLGDHRFRIASWTDPATLRAHFDVTCPGCGTYVSLTVDASSGQSSKIVKYVLQSLMRELRNVVQSCQEQFERNVASAIIES